MKKLYSTIKLIFLAFSFIFSQENSVKNDSVFISEKSIEAESVIISLSVNPENVSPTAYRLTLYPRSRPAEIFMTKLFFPEDTFHVILPLNILSPDSLGNVARLEPMGESYEPQFRMFNAKPNEIKLHPFVISVISDIIKINIIDQADGNPVRHAKLYITQNGILLTSTTVDSSGYKRVRVPVSRNVEEPVILSIDSDGSYPFYQTSLLVQGGISEKTIKLTQFNLKTGEAVYLVINELVPFRDGPENGANTLFLLNKGDQVVISKVAGGRYYGRFRILLEDKNTYNNHLGWILAKDVSLQN